MTATETKNQTCEIKSACSACPMSGSCSVEQKKEREEKALEQKEKKVSKVPKRFFIKKSNVGRLQKYTWIMVPLNFTGRTMVSQTRTYYGCNDGIHTGTFILQRKALVRKFLPQRSVFRLYYKTHIFLWENTGNISLQRISFSCSGSIYDSIYSENKSCLQCLEYSGSP